jgi:hypothetical protein
MNNQPNSTDIRNTNGNKSDDDSTTSQHTIQKDPNNTNDSDFLQPVITPPVDNYPFGDLINKKANSTVPIYYKNINGANTYNSWNTWDQAFKTTNELEIDIVGYTETNINWNEKNRSYARSICHKHNKAINIHTSSSIEATKTTYQPGGTATILTGNITGRSTGQINDKSGMGRWSGFRLKNKHKQPTSKHNNRISATKNKWYSHMLPTAIGKL